MSEKKQKQSIADEILADARKTLEGWDAEEPFYQKFDKKSKRPAGKKDREPQKAVCPEPPVRQKPAAKSAPKGKPSGGKKSSGGQFHELPYGEQLRIKQSGTERAFKKFGKVLPIVGMENPFHYRMKVQTIFGNGRGNRIISGLYQPSTHRIVPMDSFPSNDKKADAVILSIRKLMKDFHMTAYDEVMEEGFLRHVLVRRSVSTGEMMVVMVTSTPIFPAKRNFVKALTKLHPEVKTIIHNIYKLQEPFALGNRDEILYGPGYIEDEFCGKKFRIPSHSFYPTSPRQSEKMVQAALKLAGLTGEETVLDAYCGIGTIALSASGSAKRVIGVEINENAVREAAQNAELNGAENMEFFAQDAGELVQEMADAGEKADVIFIDPPRNGCDELFLDGAVRLNPNKILCFSANAESQVQDLEFLTARGYRAESIQPFDVFPQTRGVETLILLVRK